MPDRDSVPQGAGKTGLTWVTARWRDEDNLSTELPAGGRSVKFYSVLHARGKPPRDYLKDSFRAGERIAVRLDTKQPLVTDHFTVNDTHLGR